MCKQKLFLVCVFLLMPQFLILGQSKNRLLKPKGFTEKITIVISGKNRTYYNLSAGNPSIINVRGPGKLRVITRTQYSPSSQGSLSYSVFYRIDGSDKKTSAFSSVSRDENADYKLHLPGKPAKGKDIIIDLGRGDHTVEFWSGSSKTKIAARYLFSGGKAKKYDWIALSPLYPNEPVDLITREDVSHYYRFSKNRPLKAKIIGPTILRILTRVENHFQMKGKINYRVQVKQDGKIQNTYLLISERSDVTLYKKPGSLVPGKAREIVIDIPAGKHMIEIYPLDEDKNTLLGKLLFPKKDVKLKE